MMTSNGKIHSRRAVIQNSNSTRSYSKDTDVNVTNSSTSNLIKKFSYQEIIVTSDKLPKFSAILNRSEVDNVDVEDLDLLQLELEALLSAVAVRVRLLGKDCDLLTCDEELLKEECHESRASSSTTKQIDILPKITTKTEISAKTLEVTEDSYPPFRVSKPKRPIDVLPDETIIKMEEKVRKCEPPNKFWTSLNPFCADISFQDIKFLEELIEKYENKQDVIKIPLLGRCYSERWAKEELMNQQCESHFAGKAKAKRTITPVESDKLLSKAENLIKGPTAIPLTERIISALVEENIEVPENDRKVLDKCLAGNGKARESGFVNSGYGMSDLERRIMIAFEEEDILDPSHQHFDNVDEVLQEIRNCRTEMEVISKYNVMNLKRLLKNAKIEVARQDLRRKLEIVDNEVFENYRTLLAAKQKKVPLSRAFQKQCWNSLKERDELKRQFELLSDAG